MTLSDTRSTWRKRIEDARSEGLAAREFFVVFTEPVGDKQAVRDTLAVHLDYQRQLEKDGNLLAAGPVSDETGSEWTGKGLIILRAASLEQARAIAEADPMHRTGVRRFTLLPWLMNEGSLTLTVKLAAGMVELS